MNKRFDKKNPQHYIAQMHYAKVTARFILFLGLAIGIIVPGFLDFLIVGQSSLFFSLNSFCVGIFVFTLLMIYYSILKSMAKKHLSEEDYEKVRRFIEPKKVSKEKKQEDTKWILGIILVIILMFVICVKLENNIADGLMDFGNSLQSIEETNDTQSSTLENQ